MAKDNTNSHVRSLAKRLFNKMITNNKSGPYLVYTIEFLSNIQILFIVAQTILNSSSKGSSSLKFIPETISVIGEFIVLHVLRTQNVTFLSFMWSISIAYLIFYITLQIVIILYPKRQSDTRLMKLMSSLQLIHSRLIFFAIHYLFTQLISLNRNCKSNQGSYFYCGKPWLASTIIFCILNILLATMREFFLFSLHKNKSISGIKSNIYHQIILLHKVLAILYCFLIQDPHTRLLLSSATSILLTTICLVKLFHKVPFYNKQLFQVNAAMTGINFALSVVSFFAVFAIDQHILFLIWIILNPLISKTLTICCQNLFSRILHGEYRSPEETLQYAYILMRENFGYTPASFFPARKSLSICVTKGVLIHQSLNLAKLNESKSQEEYNGLVYEHLMEQLSSKTNKYSSSEDVILLTAKISLEKQRNVHQAIVLMKKLEPMTLSLHTDLLLEEFSQKLKDTYKRECSEKEENANKSNLLGYFAAIEEANVLKKAIQEEVDNHILFWEELQQKKVNLNKMLNIASIIGLLYTEIQRRWHNKTGFLMLHSINPIIMHATYLSLTWGDTENTNKVTQKFKALSYKASHQHRHFDVYSKEAAAIIISIEKATLGQITDASGSVESLFHIEKHKLIGQSLGSFLPSITAINLLSQIKDYARRADFKAENKFKGYGRTHDDSIFEAEIELKAYPDINKGIQLLALFKSIHSAKSLLIVDTQGNIVGCEKTLRHIINIPSQKDRQTRLQDFAPEFDQINTAFNLIYYEGKSVEGSLDHSPESQNASPSHQYRQSHSSRTKNSSKFLTLSASKPLTNRNCSKDEQKKPNNAYLDIVSAQELCESFKIGSKIKLITSSFRDSSLQYEIQYTVQITSELIQGELYKVLTFLDLIEAKKENTKTTIQNIDGRSSFELSPDFPKTNEHEHHQKPRAYLTLDEIPLTTNRYIYSKESGARVDTRLSKDLGGRQETDSSRQLLTFKQKFNQNEESVSSGYSNRSSESIRSLRALFGKEKYYPLSRKIRLILLINLAALTVLAGLNFFFSDESLQRVQKGVELINLSNLRLSNVLRAWEITARFMNTYNQYTNGNITTFQILLLQQSNTILTLNNEINEKISENTDKAFLETSFAQDISLWGAYSNKTLTGGRADIFTATVQIVGKLKYIARIGEAWSTPDNFNRIIYVMNNTGNDYLIYSEKIIGKTQQVLRSTIINNITILQVVLGLETFCLALVVSALLVTAWIVINKQKQLFVALLKIENTDINQRREKLRQLTVLLDEEIETKSFGSSALTLLEPLSRKNASYNTKYQRNVSKQEHENRLKTRGTVLNLFKLVGISFLTIIIVVVPIGISLQESFTSFNSLKQTSLQLSAVTHASSLISSTIGNFYVEIDLVNTTTIKVLNESPETQLLKNIDQLSVLNTKLFDVFFSGTQQRDAYLENIFMNDICSFISQANQAYCQSASGGGLTNLFDLNSKFYMTMSYYTTIFLATPTATKVKSFFASYIGSMRPCAETLGEAYLLINVRILTIVEEQVKTFSKRAAILHALIFMAIAFSGLFIQFVALGRIKKLDMCRGKVLKLIPYTIYSQSKAMEFFLRKFFQDSNESVPINF